MTAGLKKAFERASALPRAAQMQLAKQLLHDVEGELSWDPTLEFSQSLLEKLAKNAVRQQKLGKTRRQGFDDL